MANITEITEEETNTTQPSGPTTQNKKPIEELSTEEEILKDINSSLRNGDMVRVLLSCKHHSLDKLGHLFTQSIIRNRKEQLEDDIVPLNEFFEKKLKI